MLSNKLLLWIVVVVIVVVVVSVGCVCVMVKLMLCLLYLILFVFNYSDCYLYDVCVDGKWMGGVLVYINGGLVMGLLVLKYDKLLLIWVEWELLDCYDFIINIY